MTSIEDLDARYYPDFVGEHARFEALVRGYLRPGDRVLDAGAGHGHAFRYDLGDAARQVVGIDVHPSVASNPNLDAASRADLGRLPFADGSFDLEVAKYVFEHLERPAPVLRELRRVLRPGGHLVFHTPNRFHYVALSAAVTPTRFHAWYKGRRRPGADVDAHPTVYRANDRRTLASLARATGFRVTELTLFEPKPTYLFFHPLAYRAGIAYERAVARWTWLEGMRANLLGVFEAV